MFKAQREKLLLEAVIQVMYRQSIELTSQALANIGHSGQQKNTDGEEVTVCVKGNK